ncbi:lysine-sensitive aspartokinase 3 [Shimwellia blattae]|uniref:Aspartokinase n=1 Tax=Shimwellia blattae (strain ATCC 29907 / DSM 4481 / JCM 1650 / NBRC 105725 / CDC 9005-74) TaxID=630626 RepID=I2B929_SHIBC|nr:lysine-sensitive aspartokinase 3 [Shimwellia blattae]AFJ47033.1 lysine-sensitive aspartokinase III [Shimwellia blattae DSM 4481 = NBRC 105725]GAB80844.1 lysine-sensitive aspartokinase [Shimwellia blattae DSM 4481 = NBRC 105725]VDY64527.1 Lysine-sensitive aspartokinase 3 [Shimwellia blattae]VEC22635.1 Lysine-sensitive aspartokinase 3 [Shimwellia blattae]
MTSIYPPVVVAKFGGTSVADFDAMRRSADIVLADNQVRLVVLSASAGVTNLLVELARGMEARYRDDHLETLRAIQYQIVDRLKQPDGIRAQVDSLIDNIARLAREAALQPTAMLTDELVSHGELLSTLIFTAIVHERGVETRWFDVRTVLRTTSHFGQAQPVVDEIARLARCHLGPCLENGLVVTQGFIGRDEHGHTTTLGRGGSDYTAALLGEALSAGRVDIWTDVAGIYTTDPRIVPAARPIATLSFAEASEMATFGAKVLHPATLLPAVRRDIPVFVGSSKQPAGGGTTVCRQSDSLPLYRALAVRRNQTLLRLYNPDMLHACGFLADIFALLASHNITVDLVTTSEVSIALTLDNTGATSGNAEILSPALLDALNARCRVEIENDLALVTLIGNRLSRENGVCNAVFSRLERDNIRLICYGASDHNLCFLMPGASADDAIRKLHRHLFE